MKLIHDDCIKAMKELPTESVDLIVADLPYGITSNKWDSAIPFSSLWEQFNRISKAISAVVLTASQPFTSALVMSNVAQFKHEWIWIKNRGSNFANTIREPMKEHESVLVFSKARWTYNKQMQKRTGAGLERVKYGVAFRSKSENYREFVDRDPAQLPELRVPSSWQKFNTENGLHPTQKPVELMKYLILTYSNPGDLVLDCCVGSGTTGIACLDTKRDFIGIEKDERYFREAESRILYAEMFT